MRQLKEGDRIKDRYGITWEISSTGKGIIKDVDSQLKYVNIGYTTNAKFCQNYDDTYLGNFAKDNNFTSLYDLLKD